MSVTPITPTPADDPTIDFVGLFADQTEDVIFGRQQDWANEGLDPVADADRWTDTREGGHWHMTVMPGTREIARLYDLAGSEVPMASFALWAWGTYLDDRAAEYGIDRKAAVAAQGVETFAGPPGTDISIGTAVSTIPQGPDDVAQEFEVTQEGTIPGGGSIDLPISARDAGKAGDVAALAITAQATPLPPGVTVSNAAPTLGGEDVESDESLRLRLLQAIIGEGGANVAAYVRRSLAFPGVGAVKVVAVWAGPNTVLVMITDPNGQPLPPSVVAGLQADLDPVAGKGEGFAPVGAEVTVETSTVLDIAVAAVVVYKSGYSSNGAGNTIALHDPIFAQIREYLLTIKPGEVVRNAHIAGIIATHEGVENVTNVQLNALAVGTDVNVALTPPEAPQLTTVAI